MHPDAGRSPVERAIHFVVSEEDRERFSRSVAKMPTACGCIEWQGSTGARGYGVFRVSGGQHRVVAHRFAYAATHGSVPRGKVICHRCDNRRCVNPDHLFAGTMSENTRDALAKGRLLQIYSEKRLAKRRMLQPVEVLEIRRRAASGKGSVRLGREFGVDDSTVRQIVRRVIWKHL